MNIFDNLIIFEMANSHQGSVEHGLHIISKMKEIVDKYNVRAAVKLQYRNLDTFIHPDYKGRKDIDHIPRFESTKLSFDDFTQLTEAVRNAGMVTMSTPFDEIGVQWCIRQNLDIIKIASCSSMDWPLMEAAVKAAKPMIVSVGGKTTEDIDKIYNFLIHRNCNFAFMHCVAEYPVEENKIQLDFIDKLKLRYRGISIGYSGHEDPDDVLVPAMAVAKGAKILERHIGLQTDTINLNAYSMNPEQCDRWVGTIVNARNICFVQKERCVSQKEKESLRSLSRGVFVNKDIAEGQPIEYKDVFLAMPCMKGQLTSSQFKSGLIASKDYKRNDAVYETVNFTDINIIRSVVHDAKGLLAEAGIALGNQFEVELSHHYGVRQFRQTGAILISMINREYCKKLLVVLAGQSHPRHAHKVKEETFQLLYGELECEVNGEKRVMQPGDIQVIRRGDIHSFSSATGAVFEEISTTHIKGDSYYEDPCIAGIDPIERKTIMKEW